MRETYCILYLDQRATPPARRLSIPYATVDEALLAARALGVMNNTPLQLRGSAGTVIEKNDLDLALQQL